MGRERRELGLPRLTPKLLWSLNGLTRVSPWNLTPCLIFPCSLFGCNQVKAERWTDQRESLPWFRRHNSRGASPGGRPGENVQGSTLADASPKNRKVEADKCTNQGLTRRTSQCLRPEFRPFDDRCDGFWGALRVETASASFVDGED